MNRKQFGILIVLLIVLGGAGWLVQRAHNRAAGAGEQGAGRKLLGESFPINDVAHISIKQGTDEVNLVKEDEVWRVRERKDYPANFSQISEFLMKAADLKVVQTEDVGASQLPRLQLATGQGTNSGTVVELKNKDDKSIRTLVLGKKLMGKSQQAQQFSFDGEFPEGRYVMVGGNDKQALLIADPLASIEPKIDQWLDKAFFKIERPKAVSVTYAGALGTNSWTIVRDTESGDWKLAGAKAGEKLDAARASDVSSPFASPSFNDVLLPGGASDATGLNKPTVVTVDTFDDLTYTVNVGSKKDDAYCLTMSVATKFPKERVLTKDEKPEDKAKADKAWAERLKQIEAKVEQTKKFEKWTYLVPTWNVDPILKNRKDLLEVKKDEKAQAKADTSGLPNPEDVIGPGGK